MKDGCSTKGGLPWFSNSLILVSDVHHARTLHPKKNIAVIQISNSDINLETTLMINLLGDQSQNSI